MVKLHTLAIKAFKRRSEMVRKLILSSIKRSLNSQLNLLFDYPLIQLIFNASEYQGVRINC